MESMVPSGWGKSLRKPAAEACGRVIELDFLEPGGAGHKGSETFMLKSLYS